MSDPTPDLRHKLVISLVELETRIILAAFLTRLHRFESTHGSDEWKRLMKLAEENCTNQTVLKWLKEKSNSFYQLVDMFNFLKKHIDEEEKKAHSNIVDITFIAHGSIGDFMMPASCLLPLDSIRDVVLYAPWNCVSDHWNSMKKAGNQEIPNISVHPLQPDDGVWKSFESLTKKYGPIGRNRIVIPFILPGQTESVPFSVVTLALSLVLLQSRFKATVHLDTCLKDSSIGQKFDKSYLEKQYACAADDTGIKCSSDLFSFSFIGFFRNFFN